MKKIITILILVLILSGCGSTRIENRAQDIDIRFKILSASNLNGNRYIAVLEDKETGCQYLYAYATNNSIGTGLTPLLDKEGKLACAE
ncbi:hypothetical protein D3C78_1589110 [compost metagenome]